MSDAEVDISVVKGSPTDEELAALVIVLALSRRRSEPDPATRPSGWSAYWRSVRAPITPGPNAWRMSGRPQ
ncbi:MAG TPA: acyl-CoA carboxylase subunit epsilon [Propionibacteriaceae bacterium]|nr:acyl-CoA carboxylase subunit epsilon [Propionibacteriaceae bacterium]